MAEEAVDKLWGHLEGVQGGLGTEGLHAEDPTSSPVGVPKDEVATGTTKTGATSRSINRILFNL